MFPLTHLWTSGLVVLLLCLSYGLSAYDMARWVLLSFLSAVLLDLDHLLLPLIFKGTRRNFVRVLNDPLPYLVDLKKMRQVLYSPGTTEFRLVLHLPTCSAIICLTILYFPQYMTPVAASLMTHFTMDFAETILDPSTR